MALFIVAADELDRSTPHRAEKAEELLQALLGPFPFYPQQALTPLVDPVDHRQVLVPMLPLNLKSGNRYTQRK